MIRFLVEPAHQCIFEIRFGKAFINDMNEDSQIWNWGSRESKRTGTHVMKNVYFKLITDVKVHLIKLRYPAI